MYTPPQNSHLSDLKDGTQICGGMLMYLSFRRKPTCSLGLLKIAFTLPAFAGSADSHRDITSVTSCLMQALVLCTHGTEN